MANAAGHSRLVPPEVVCEFRAFGQRVLEPLIGLIGLGENVLRWVTVASTTGARPVLAGAAASARHRDSAGRPHLPSIIARPILLVPRRRIAGATAAPQAGAVASAGSPPDGQRQQAVLAAVTHERHHRSAEDLGWGARPAIKLTLLPRQWEETAYG